MITPLALTEKLPAFEFYCKKLHRFTAPKNGLGWLETGTLCPFCQAETADSFKCNLQTGAFFCSSCFSSGSDIIAFEMLQSGCGLREALEILAVDFFIC